MNSVSQPAAQEQTQDTAALKIADALDNLILMPASYAERDTCQWFVVDAATAEPEVNWPGDLISTHANQAEARIGRAEAILRIMNGAQAKPRLNIMLETRDGCITGTTNLNVLRVDAEDDGSFTAVSDYWPGDAGLKLGFRHVAITVTPFKPSPAASPVEYDGTCAHPDEN